MSKQLTIDELLAADENSLSIEDMQRKITVIQMRKASMECEVVASQVSEFQDKKEERARHAATMRQLVELEDEKKAMEQNRCRHKSGGKGYAGWFNGDGKQGYTICKQQLPTKDIYAMCTRCQKRWDAPDKFAVINFYRNLDPTKPKMSFEEYQKQMAAYIWAMSVETPLFDSDGGIPGSVLFNVPWLEKKRANDAEQFAILAAEKGWKVNSDAQELAL